MELVQVGRVRRAFGLKGELVVEASTNEPGVVFAPGRRVFADVADVADVAGVTDVADRAAAHRGGPDETRECTVERSRPFKGAWLVKLDGVASKTEADRWRGVRLSAPAAELTPPADNELYLHELDGMRVRDEAHGDLGVVADWYAVPQGLVLEVRGAMWRADVPFNEAFVVKVDRIARAIDVRLPDGLLEQNPPPAS